MAPPPASQTDLDRHGADLAQLRQDHETLAGEHRGLSEAYGTLSRAFLALRKQVEDMVSNPPNPAPVVAEAEQAGSGILAAIHDKLDQLLNKGRGW